MPSWEGIKSGFYDNLTNLLEHKNENMLGCYKNEGVKYIYFCRLDELHNLIHYIENLMLEKHMNMCDKRAAIIVRLTENIFNKYNLNIDEYIHKIKEKIKTQKKNVLLNL